MNPINLIMKLTGLSRGLSIAALGIAALGLGYGGFKLWLWLHDRAVIEKHDDAVNLENEKGAREADSKAADQRLRDAEAQREQERALTDAINNPKPGDSADPHVRLDCERLRRAGQNTAAIPACGGR